MAGMQWGFIAEAAHDVLSGKAWRIPVIEISTPNSVDFRSFYPFPRLLDTLTCRNRQAPSNIHFQCKDG